MADNNKGVWLDKETGKVVTSKPARARQLVAPGRDARNEEKALVERFKSDAGGDGSAAPMVVKSASPSKPAK